MSKIGDYVTAKLKYEHLGVRQGVLAALVNGSAIVVGQAGVYRCYPDTVTVQDKDIISDETRSFVEMVRAAILPEVGV